MLHQTEEDTQPGAGDDAILSNCLSEEQLAAELGITIRTLARWRALREGPAVTRIGRAVYYARDDVRNWLTSQRREVG